MISIWDTYVHHNTNLKGLQNCQKSKFDVQKKLKTAQWEHNSQEKNKLLQDFRTLDFNIRQFCSPFIYDDIAYVLENLVKDDI